MNKRIELHIETYIFFMHLYHSINIQYVNNSYNEPNRTKLFS